MPQKNLNEREKAILRLGTFEKLTWQQMYLLAKSDDWKVTQSYVSFEQMVTKWKNSPIVSAYFQEQKEERNKEQRKTKATLQRELNERAQNADTDLTEFAKALESNKNVTDYRKKENIISEVNSILNRLTNDSDKLPYIKMLSDLLQFKQDSPNKEIQRFYTPLNCKGCELYRKELQSLESEKNDTI